MRSETPSFQLIQGKQNSDRKLQTKPGAWIQPSQAQWGPWDPGSRRHGLRWWRMRCQTFRCSRGRLQFQPFVCKQAIQSLGQQLLHNRQKESWAKTIWMATGSGRNLEQVDPRTWASVATLPVTLVYNALKTRNSSSSEPWIWTILLASPSPSHMARISSPFSSTVM